MSWVTLAPWGQLHMESHTESPCGLYSKANLAMLHNTPPMLIHPPPWLARVITLLITKLVIAFYIAEFPIIFASIHTCYQLSGYKYCCKEIFSRQGVGISVQPKCTKLPSFIVLVIVIVSHLMKTLFCVLWINLYYVKLSAKQVVHVASMSIFLTLNQTVATLTKVTDKSDLHKGGTINLK